MQQNINYKEVVFDLLGGENFSAVVLVERIIEMALSKFASDIHINPEESVITLRLRVDGIMQKCAVLPKELHSALINRIKIMSGLRTDEHHAPQDGRFSIHSKHAGKLDVRVSIVPAYHGENIVLRLLSVASGSYALEAMGFVEKDLQKIFRVIRKSGGMILITGPTGSGKSTTLYALLGVLNSPEVSIITIEDPVEYAISGIQQLQVNNKTGLSFANGLRSILRQDPNIIMVGEIRDRETAGIAINTALTGHLLLSTLHTTDAATALPRLLDMNIETYLIASTVNLIIGQRLVRRICPACKIQKSLSAAELESLSVILPENFLDSGAGFYAGSGCENCENTGFLGRLGVYEVMAVEDNIREAIFRHAPAAEIRGLAIKSGMTPLFLDALEKARAGETTIEEVLRINYD